jgi:vacuolar-type H+-ATPase subunit H
VSRAEILVKIKDAESKAKDYLTEAEDQSKAIVATARKESIRMIREAEEGMKSEYDSALAHEKAKIASQRNELLKSLKNLRSRRPTTSRGRRII